MNATPGFGAIVALMGVIALIPLALWLLKRTPLGGAAHGPMRLVGTLALTPAQRLVTVEVGAGDERRWLVLAVGPSGVQTVHTMAVGEDPAAAMQGNAATARRVMAPAHAVTQGVTPAVTQGATPAVTQSVGQTFARLLAAQRNLVR